jgi:segregation and condensation protein A
MARIKSQLTERRRIAFRDLFQTGMHKSALIGMFLAVLELVRHHQVQAEQGVLFGELWLLPGQQVDAPLDLADVDEYEHGGGSGRDD